MLGIVHPRLDGGQTRLAVGMRIYEYAVEQGVCRIGVAFHAVVVHEGHLPLGIVGFFLQHSLEGFECLGFLACTVEPVAHHDAQVEVEGVRVDEAFEFAVRPCVVVEVGVCLHLAERDGLGLSLLRLDAVERGEHVLVVVPALVYAQEHLEVVGALGQLLDEVFVHSGGSVDAVAEEVVACQHLAKLGVAGLQCHGAFLVGKGQAILSVLGVVRGKGVVHLAGFGVEVQAAAVEVEGIDIVAHGPLAHGFRIDVGILVHCHGVQRTSHEHHYEAFQCFHVVLCSLSLLWFISRRYVRSHRLRAPSRQALRRTRVLPVRSVPQSSVPRARRG